MSTPRTPFVTVDEVAATEGPTYGLTAKQVRFDIQHGYLPGSIDYRKRIVIRRAEWDAYLSGEWQPAEPGSHKAATAERKVPGIVSIERKAS